MEYLDENRILNAYYHKKLRSGTRVGVVNSPLRGRSETASLVFYLHAMGVCGLWCIWYIQTSYAISQAV